LDYGGTPDRDCMNECSAPESSVFTYPLPDLGEDRGSVGRSLQQLTSFHRWQLRTRERLQHLRQAVAVIAPGIDEITSKEIADLQQSVYDNRRRVQGNYGKILLRRRGELVERSFAHCYDTRGLRHTHLRKHNNILKRQLIHVAGFNLSLICRRMLGAGTPREWKNLGGVVFLFLRRLLMPGQEHYRPCRSSILRSRLIPAAAP
jgi:hypothetical protein